MEQQSLNIEDALCKAFIMSLGAGMPNYEAVSHMCKFVKGSAQVEDEALTEDYVYRMIPQYINFLFNKFNNSEI